MRFLCMFNVYKFVFVSCIVKTGGEIVVHISTWPMGSNNKIHTQNSRQPEGIGKKAFFISIAEKVHFHKEMGMMHKINLNFTFSLLFFFFKLFCEWDGWCGVCIFICFYFLLFLMYKRKKLLFCSERCKKHQNRITKVT